MYTELEGTWRALAPFMPQPGTRLALTLSTMGASSCHGKNSLAPGRFTSSSFLGKWHRSCLVGDHCDLWILPVNCQCVIPIGRRCDLPVDTTRRSGNHFIAARNIERNTPEQLSDSQDKVGVHAIATALFFRFSVRTLKLKFKVTASPGFHTRSTLKRVPSFGWRGSGSVETDNSARLAQEGILK